MTEIIAHRGASAQERENTLAAFAAAVSLGADGIELDVRRTVDGRPVVHHDAHLSDGRLICATRASDLPEHVPGLVEALAACGDLMVNVEIKNIRSDPDFDPDQTMAQAVVDAVQQMGIVDRVVVSSFGWAAIERVRAIEPRLRTAWLVSPSSTAPRRLIERTAAAGHAGIHPKWTMADVGFVDAAHDAGLFVNVWTVDDPVRIRALAAVGVDGIVTNVPDVARTALGGP